MFPLPQVLKIAAGAAILALSVAHHATGADVPNLGPVEACQPFITMVGSKHVVGCYVPGASNDQAVTWKEADTQMLRQNNFG